MTPEAVFYHLTTRSLEAAAPEVLEKCLERGWRVTVRAGSRARVESLVAALWTYRDDAFLPHGDASDGRPERQPIYLTDGPEKPNAPDVLMLVDSAEAAPGEFAAHARVVLMFDSADEAAVAAARAAWRRAKAEGAVPTYWAQGPDGRWTKRAAG